MDKKIDRCINGLICNNLDYYKDMLKRYERTKKCFICGKRIINTCWIPNYKEGKNVVCTECAGSDDTYIQSKIGEYKDSKILYIIENLNDIKMTFTKKVSSKNIMGMRVFLKCEKFGLDEFTEVFITDLQSIFIDEDISEMYYSKKDNWIYCCKDINGESVVFYIGIEVLGYNLNGVRETKVFTDFKPREFTLRMIDLGDSKNVLIRLELDDHILELDASKIE